MPVATITHAPIQLPSGSGHLELESCPESAKRPVVMGATIRIRTVSFPHVASDNHILFCKSEKRHVIRNRPVQFKPERRRRHIISPFSASGLLSDNAFHAFRTSSLGKHRWSDRQPFPNGESAPYTKFKIEILVAVNAPPQPPERNDIRIVKGLLYLPPMVSAV